MTLLERCDHHCHREVVYLSKFWGRLKQFTGEMHGGHTQSTLERSGSEYFFCEFSFHANISFSAVGDVNVIARSPLKPALTKGCLINLGVLSIGGFHGWKHWQLPRPSYGPPRDTRCTRNDSFRDASFPRRESLRRFDNSNRSGTCKHYSTTARRH